MHFILEAYRADDAGDSDPDPLFTATVPTLDALHERTEAEWPGASYTYIMREGNVATYGVYDAESVAVAVLIVEPIL